MAIYFLWFFFNDEGGHLDLWTNFEWPNANKLTQKSLENFQTQSLPDLWLYTGLLTEIFM